MNYETICTDGRSVAFHLSECRRMAAECRKGNATIYDLKAARRKAYEELGKRASENMGAVNHLDAVRQALAAKKWNDSQAVH